MRKIWLLFLAFLFFANLTFALDCQYTEMEKYNEDVNFFYHNGEKFEENLNISELITINIGGENNAIITITNNLEVPISLNVTYHQYSKFYGFDNYATSQITVDSRDYNEIRGAYHTSSIKKYIFIEPNLITSEIVSVEKERAICKKCEDKICLNDGVSCNPLYDDINCGSEICNIAGFCGNIKIVDCPNGKLNCNDKNCLDPSTKEVGEGYECSFECKSDRFKNGTCLKNSLILQQEKDDRLKQQIIFWTIILIIASVGVGYFAFYRRKKEEKGRDKIKKEKQNLSNEIKELEQNKNKLELIIKNLKNEIKSLNFSIGKGKKIIKKLKENIKNSEGIAKKELENKLRIEENRQKDRIEKLKTKNLVLSKKENNVYTMENNLRNRKIKIEKDSPEVLAKELHKKYGSSSRKIYYDGASERIWITSKYTSPEPFSRYLYKKEISSNLQNKQIHHIDYDSLNDENLYNLILLSKVEHDKIIHSNITKRDWKSGIKEIKSQLNMKDSDFPKHIQKEIEKRKRQIKLGKYAKRSARERR